MKFVSQQMCQQLSSVSLHLFLRHCAAAKTRQRPAQALILDMFDRLLQFAFLSGIERRAFRRSGCLNRQRALNEGDADDGLVTVIGVDPVDDTRRFMLQFNRAPVCDPDHQGSPQLPPVAGGMLGIHARPANPFRGTEGRDVFAHNLAPMRQNFGIRKSMALERLAGRPADVFMKMRGHGQLC